MKRHRSRSESTTYCSLLIKEPTKTFGGGISVLPVHPGSESSALHGIVPIQERIGPTTQKSFDLMLFDILQFWEFVLPVKNSQLVNISVPSKSLSARSQVTVPSCRTLAATINASMNVGMTGRESIVVFRSFLSARGSVEVIPETTWSGETIMLSKGDPVMLEYSRPKKPSSLVSEGMLSEVLSNNRPDVSPKVMQKLSMMDERSQRNGS